MHDDRTKDFIRSFIQDDEGLLSDIYIEARENGVPVIRPEARDLLKVLLSMNRPERILEIGTAVGYSALMMDQFLKSLGVNHHIDTCEFDEKRISTAKKNISLMNREEFIEIFPGDAAETLDNMIGKLSSDGGGCVYESYLYDFVFIDAAKAQYKVYLDKTMELVHSGSVIVTDNILQEGEVLESHFLVEKRDRTIHDRMRDYLYYIKNDSRLETTILEAGDGVAVSVVK